jgi:CheY-like chemotaxis protein
VLVVEDDELVRRYACTELRSLGYRVLDADCGASALQIVERREDIELLFTDVVMPGGMSGRALADAARRLRPGLRVLYTSGYTENAIVHHGRLDAGVMLLAKPYRRAELARAIRAALAA